MNTGNFIARLLCMAVLFIRLLTGGADYLKLVNEYPLGCYRPAPSCYRVRLDNSIPLSCLDDRLLDNRDRGFRTEVYLTLGSGKGYPASGSTAYDTLRGQIGLYGEDRFRVIQTYIYLIEYVDRPLDALAFSQLTDYLAYIDSLGYQCLLRFAYEYDASAGIGPATDWIVAHAAQLKGWFTQNLALVNRVVFAVQLGMIGLWGEGHTSVYPHDAGIVTAAVADMVPENIYLMCRHPRLLPDIGTPYYGRYGLHDDFLVGISHPWGMLDFDHPQYKRMLNRCNYFINDGEMPWGSDNTVEAIDPVLFLRQCVGYSLTTLSITHNYKETAGANYELNQYKSVKLSKSLLLREKFPFNPRFLDENGEISVFTYLQYHLGYLLCASNMKYKNGKLEFMLTNFGMAAPFEYELVIYGDGTPYPTAFDPLDLIKFSQQKYCVAIGEHRRVGIALVHRRSGQTIKLANDIPYENGINWIV